MQLIRPIGILYVTMWRLKMKVKAFKLNQSLRHGSVARLETQSGILWVMSGYLINFLISKSDSQPFS